jgi:hypothetical protein
MITWHGTYYVKIFAIQKSILIKVSSVACGKNRILISLAMLAWNRLIIEKSGGDAIGAGFVGSSG